MQTLDLHSGLLHQGMQCKSNIFSELCTLGLLETGQDGTRAG